MADDRFRPAGTARRVLLLGLVCASPALAQQARPVGMSLAEAAARRFPQPVRVSDLIGRRVLEPVESQPVLGRVQGVVSGADGEIHLVLRAGGVLGFFTRLVSVPVEAVGLLGQEVVLVEFTPGQLAAMQDFDPSGATPLQGAASIRVGLVRPSH